MVMNILFVTGLVILASFFARIVDVYRKKEKRAQAYRMSFRETLDLTDIPIVTFKCGEKKLNFLLDTGASDSIINKSVTDDIKHSPTGVRNTIYGSDGNKEEVDITSIDITYRDKTYSEEFYVKDLDAAFSNLKSDFGVNLSGVLGSSFFQKYKYIIDFDEMAAYNMI